MQLEKYGNKKLNILKKTIKNVNRRLSVMPEGRVKIRNRRGKYSISVITGGKKLNAEYKETYKSLASSDTQRYATKLYLEELLTSLESELSALNTFLQNYNPRKKYEVLSDFPTSIRDLINQPLVSPEELSRAWANVTYATNPMAYDERYEYYTNRGERVRSRAELFIADMLFQLGIPYRYEMLYIANGHNYYPDFTLMNPFTGELFFVEYFGLMDDDDYRQNSFAKIKEYNRTPEADKFIFIFESQLSSMDTVGIRNLILLRMGLSVEDLLSTKAN